MSAGRLILVDDSRTARTIIGAQLRALGWLVDEANDAAHAAELAIRSPPDAIVTDLWMPGISGLQLCRVMRAEPATRSVPIILLTGADDRRNRFWAMHAGATAFINKQDTGRLASVLAGLRSGSRPDALPASLVGAVASGKSVIERLSQLLDTALFESTIAGEVRALSQAADLDAVFAGIARIASSILAYRWLALTTVGQPDILLHAAERMESESEARLALGIALPLHERRSHAPVSDRVIVDDRAVASAVRGTPLVLPVLFGAEPMGTLAFAPVGARPSDEDREFLSIVAAELGGPLRMVTLVEEARRLARTDTLTGLGNRRAFFEAVERRPRGVPHSLLLLDVDHFKRVNDTHGHDAGDSVIRAVSAVASRVARRADVVARWGGEEIVVLLVGAAEAGARIAAERLRRAIEHEGVPLSDGSVVTVTASIGAASASDAGFDIADLVARADRAMYLAKERGRNRVEVG